MKTIRSNRSEDIAAEELQRYLIAAVNEQIPEGATQGTERLSLEKEYGKVWSPEELAKEFRVLSILAPLVYVRNITTGQTGTLLFQHYPRYYYDFLPEEQ
ncbi:MAG TPA: hypothetical protein P5244_02850 [Syntrophales bacterium]|nr:hypothetical protein [Syntrophales bacterium]